MDDFSEWSKAQPCSDVYPETSILFKVYFEGMYVARVLTVFQQYWMWLLILKVTFTLFSKTYEAINKERDFFSCGPHWLKFTGTFESLADALL